MVRSTTPEGQPYSCPKPSVGQRSEKSFTPCRHRVRDLVTSFFDMCSTPGGASEKLGRTNLAVSGILTDYKELSVNNSIWMPWDTNVANIRDNVAPARIQRDRRSTCVCHTHPHASYIAPGRLLCSRGTDPPFRSLFYPCPYISARTLSDRFLLKFGMPAGRASGKNTWVPCPHKYVRATKNRMEGV